MSDRIAELLLKGLRQLSQEEQDEVVASLLGGVGRTPASQPHVQPLAQPLPWAVPTGAASARLVELIARGDRPGMTSAETGAESGGLKVLPVRLPAADYDRLREWSRTHDFSMAVIIRTLVERFLDDQQRRAGPAAPSAPPAAEPEQPPG